MVDFKAPPPPPEDFSSDSQEEVVTSENENTQAEAVQQEGENVSSQNDAVQQNLEKLQTKGSELKAKFNALQEPKKLTLVAGCMFMLGMLFGIILFGGGGGAPPAPQGLQGVVSNPDVKAGVKRCGRQESSTRACVLYIMNSSNHDKIASDFFEAAVALTGRRDFQIRSDNMHYRTTRIPPGHFAQIYIPSVD